MQDKNRIMEEVYLKNRKKIYDFLFKYTNNPDTAMELMQDTFLSFFKNYADMGFSSEKATMILYTIARNSSINFAKKFSTKKETALDVDLYRSSGVSFETKEELKDLEARLYACLQLLPEDQRTALLLKNVEEMTLAQIAEIMGSSISTISRLVVKAMANLLEIAEQRGIKP